MSEPAGSISVYGPSQCGEEGRECLLTLSGAARWPRAPSRRSSSGRGRGLGACRGSSRRCLSTLAPMDDEALAKRFGRLVRRLRTEKGYSQEEFSFRVGLHQTYVSSVERGRGT